MLGEKIMMDGYRISEDKEVSTKIEIEKSKALCFTGPRPKKLPGGYNLHSNQNQSLYKLIKNQIKLKIEEGFRFFISGSALGVDTMAFFAVNSLKSEYKNIEIFNILYIPIYNQGSTWSSLDQKRYKLMKEWSDMFVYTESFVDENSSIGYKMNFRNQLMVSSSSAIISVYKEGFGGGTMNCIKMAYGNSLDNTMINPENLTYSAEYPIDVKGEIDYGNKRNKYRE